MSVDLVSMQRIIETVEQLAAMRNIECAAEWVAQSLVTYRNVRTVADVQQLDELTLVTTMHRYPVAALADCDLCGEPEDGDDPLGHYWDATNLKTVLAHGQCGEDAGHKLA